ncbi:MAG TPA: glycoside hydrolase family 76 protein [Candidatus Gallibacteroides avistercoris]|uniref:Glycoside hydrolase family 76 protein n=1 Tax=Candidatus Gallibacteroides avistercoris TaxID=2840833 RepID=A0A9D1SD90_9BACT|nr:glycoside hydrolase family 76 protein [Candidatus Gallibacteroides avistercoris]
MKKFYLCLLLLIPTLTITGKNSISDKERTQAFDAFHTSFYNPEMKLYAIDSDKKGRAAIWTQAIYWDMIMNTYKRTGEKRYRQLIEEIYQGGYEQYSGYDWTDKHEWFIYDDMMWWIISLGRAYQITGEGKYLAHASSGFFYVWKEAYDTDRGGVWWNFIHDAKMACINFPTVIAAMTLFDITQDSDYLNKAQEVYHWARSVFFDEEQGRIADNMHYNHLYQNSMQIDWTTQLYNQGTFIGAATLLYKATGDKKYLADAIKAADYTQQKMCYGDRILEFKNGIEQGIYTAIFAQYIALLIEEGDQPQYTEWLRHNVATAWKNRDKSRNLTFKDADKPCPTGRVEVYDASGCPALMQVIK